MQRIITLFRRIRPVWLRWAIAGLSCIGLLSGLFVLSIYLGMWGKLPSYAELRNTEQPRASEVYTSDSVLIGKYYLYDRQVVSGEEIPAFVLQALVAIEDERYYKHSGIDYPSLFRVFFKTILLQDAGSGGGSTLSQQLAKNLYPRSGKGRMGIVVDKLKEMFTARRLERLYDKDTLLVKYLNTVSFGDNSFGIESASRKFYSKSASDLQIEEAATLIGMLKATYSYNPRVFPERSLERRNLVLQSMKRNGFLAEREADSLKQLPLEIQYNSLTHDTGPAAYFREAVRKQSQKILEAQKETDKGNNLYTSGLKIYTTLDSRMQDLAEVQMRQHLKSLQAEVERAYGRKAPWLADKKFINRLLRNSTAWGKLKAAGLSEGQIRDSLLQEKPLRLKSWEGYIEKKGSTLDSLLHYAKFLNTGVLAMEAKSGAVKVWVGGIDFENYKFDHISQSRRQTGSTFKPLVYLTALQQGVDPCSYFSAREVRYENLEDWTPSNSGDSDETYLNYSMQYALKNSVNTVAVKILEKTGIPPVIELTRKLGITADLPELPSLALGTGAIGIPELAAAYSSLLNSGKPSKPFMIREIHDVDDQVIYQHKPEASVESAYSEQSRKILLELLKSVVDSGTASRLRSRYGIRGELAGKTGTTQNNKDAWFVALSPKLVHISWVGFDQHEIGFPNTAIGQGANAALPLFANWYKALGSHKELASWTGGSFGPVPEEISKMLDCPGIKRDGFFKRLFSNPDKTKKRKFRSKS
ncbi:transglycosylase domain-containing protein [Robiginitalea sp. IMCC43444]|uniref:transglycosylase domain-containing protein n=1 Tax=Robiginitalea sp. IMCC43444 TaxID=3459121 RepID=UPI004041DAB4